MTSEIGATLAFGVLALLLILTGKRWGFFNFPVEEWDVPLRLLHVIGAFAIYFAATYVSLSLAVKFLRNQIMSNYLGYSSWLNFSISFSIFLFLAIYFIFLPKNIRMGIFRRPNEEHSVKEDIWAAFTAWVLAFPLVLFLSQVIELVVFKVFQVTQLPDQIAVKFLKSTFENPVYLALAVIAIIILAPLIEETLFRGFLQTYIRRHLGPKQAIVITSVCFSLFHYAAGQGLGNISIILSLFVLSLFLGFVYHKQGSLLASIILHGAFNLVSVVNLYLFGGFTTGL
jgi:hypothetical protein